MADQATGNEYPAHLDRASDEPLWTVEEAATYLKLKPDTVRSMARRRELPAIKVGRVWRFRPLDLKSKQ